MQWSKPQNSTECWRNVTLKAIIFDCNQRTFWTFSNKTYYFQAALQLYFLFCIQDDDAFSKIMLCRFHFHVPTLYEVLKPFYNTNFFKHICFVRCVCSEARCVHLCPTTDGWSRAWSMHYRRKCEERFQKVLLSIQRICNEEN